MFYATKIHLYLPVFPLLFLFFPSWNPSLHLGPLSFCLKHTLYIYFYIWAIHMAQNSKVQKCTIIDVSLSYPCPQPKTIYCHMYIEHYLEGYTPSWEQWSVYLVSHVWDDNVFLSPACKEKESGPRTGGRRPSFLTASHEAHTAHSLSVSSSSSAPGHSPADQGGGGQGSLSPGWLRTMAPGYHFMFINSFDPYGNWTSMVTILQMSKLRQREVREPTQEAEPRFKPNPTAQLQSPSFY